MLILNLLPRTSGWIHQSLRLDLLLWMTAVWVFLRNQTEALHFLLPILSLETTSIVLPAEAPNFVFGAELSVPDSNSELPAWAEIGPLSSSLSPRVSKGHLPGVQVSVKLDT